MDAWKPWISTHATLFPAYLTRDGGLETLAGWATVFARIGATPAEMADASYELAAAAVPSWAEDHRLFLRERAVAAARRRAGPRAAPAEASRGCKLCHETGMVSVPQPRAVAGLAPWATAAVTCRCPLGLFIADDQRRRWPAKNLEPMMTIRDHEDSYPDWRNDLIRHEDLLRAEAAAEATTRSRFGRSGGRIAPVAFDEIIAHRMKGAAG